jgi:hypothetical protein
MATRFRTLACPVDASTGDQRRFADGALTSQPLPMPLRWVRSDVGGHDGAVTFGAIQEIEFSGTDVWLEGTIFDDVDREVMPRMAEDVAEAMKLITEGVVGISVDLDAAEMMYVREGTDEPLTEEDFGDPDLKAEALITKGRVRSGTLVAIPAFVETNHTFELFPGEEVQEEEAATTAALIASVGVDTRVPLAAFTPPVPITGPTPMTWDFGANPPVVYGHALTWNTCHVGFSDSCVLAPRDPDDGEYRDFHVYAIETDAGPLFAGRITAGGDHPRREALTAHDVRRHHDGMETAAYVRATEDDYGLLLCGPIQPDISDSTLRILSRRKVSGHWTDSAQGLTLVEVLALKPGPRATSEPGFPVAGFRNGRQVSLTAAMGPEADDTRPAPNIAEIFRTAYSVIREEEAKAADAERARLELAGDLEIEAAAMRAELIEDLEVDHV